MSKKYDFSFDVSALSTYTNENTDLIARALYGATTINSGIQVLPGQKGDVKLNKLNHNLYLQAAACGWSVSGDTDFNQVSVDVCSIDYKEAVCPKTLEPYWQGQLMAQGSDPETFPFAQYIVDNKADALSSQVEYMFWQGDSTFGSGNLALCDGIGAFLSGATGDVYVSAAATGGTFGSAAINTAIQAMINEVDERVYNNGDLALYMSVANYKIYVNYLISANLYNYAQNVDGKTLKTTIPGHNIEVIGTPGLRGTNYFYLTPKSNLVFVTDLLDETEDLDMWYSQDNREVRIAGSFKFGVGVYWNEFMVHNNSNLQ